MNWFRQPAASVAALSALSLALGACGGEQEVAPTPPVEVTVTKVTARSLTLADELPGRVVAYRVAEIRPQVSGIVQRRLFEQGAYVRAGRPLFQINAAPFVADANSAAATLQRATATYDRAKVQAERLRPLVAADAVSRSVYDDAVAARNQAAADVAQARAALARRRLDVSFASVSAPISGRIGPTLVTEGALVGANDAQPLATIQQIDRVYIDVRQRVERLEALREAMAKGAGPGTATVEILSTSGKAYPMKGKLLFSDITVDAGTGNAVVRVVVDNPDARLLPGMFVRARLPRSSQAAALTVPQQAVVRDSAGAAQVNVLDTEDRVHVRNIKVRDVIDGDYVVESGLRGGETIIVEGHDRIRPNTPVKTSPWRAPSKAGR